jgi:tetratricopeptide (TPR) repeat protein
VEKLRQRVLGAVAAHYDSELSHGRVRWPLLDAYLEFRRGREVATRDQQMQRLHYERALDLDPDFFFPTYPLHWQYLNIFECDKAASVLRRFQDRQGRLTPYERLLYGERRADMEGRFNEQLRFMYERAKLTPDDLSLKENIGLYELFVRRPRDSVRTCRAVLSSRPATFPIESAFPQPFYFLAHDHHRLGEYEDELSVVQEGRRHFPDSLELRARQMAALVAQGRLAEADQVVEEAVATPAQMGRLGMFLVMSADELQAHGHRKEAMRLADRAVAWFAGRPVGEQPADRPIYVLALFLAERWQAAKPVAEAIPESAVGNGYPDGLLPKPAVYRLGWLGSTPHGWAAKHGTPNCRAAPRLPEPLSAVRPLVLAGGDRRSAWREGRGPAALRGRRRPGVLRDLAGGP